MNIDEFVSNAILETPVEIKIGEKHYKIAPPTTATLIEVSKYIAAIPELGYSNEKLNRLADGNIEDGDFYLGLHIAKDCAYIGDILAVLMLGSKNIKGEIKTVRTQEKRYLYGLIKRRRQIETTEEVNRQKELAQIILNELTVKETNELTSLILSQLGVGFFLTSIGFLQKIRILKPTTTTASGQ